VPSQVSLENFSGRIFGFCLGNIFGDSSGPSLRRATTLSKAYYQVSATSADTLSLSIVAANGGADPASVVVWKRVIPRYVAVDTIVVAPSGWGVWQTLAMSRSLPVDSGINNLQITFLGDTGTALMDIGGMAIGSAVTRLKPVAAAQPRISLRRQGRSLRVELPEGSAAVSVEILSADGRVWARQTISGSSALPLPNTHAPLWVRVRGGSTLVLSVPPGF
jgi:hypothetical protein